MARPLNHAPDSIWKSGILLAPLGTDVEAGALQTADRIGDKPVAANLVAGEALLIDEQNAVAATCEMNCSGSAGGARARYGYVPDVAFESHKESSET